MSTSPDVKQPSPPRDAVESLMETGFVAFEHLPLLWHPDGRVAAVLEDGRHMVHERFVDALNWHKANSTQPDDQAESVR